MEAFVAQTVKCLPTMRQTWVCSPGLGRSPGEGNGNPLQYSCLENSMDGGAWWATVHGVAKSRTRLSDFTPLCFMDSYQTFLLYTFPKFSRQSLSSLWLDVIMWVILANELWTRHHSHHFLTGAFNCWCETSPEIFFSCCCINISNDSSSMILVLKVRITWVRALCSTVMDK